MNPQPLKGSNKRVIMNKLIAFIIILFFSHNSFAQKDSTLKKKDRKRDVLLQTSFGDITIRLADSTPPFAAKHTTQHKGGNNLDAWNSSYRNHRYADLSSIEL